MHQRQRQRGAGALAQAQVELHQRLHVEVVELHAVTGLLRAVREHAVGQHVGVDRVRDQCRRGDDEAVDQDQHAFFGRAEHGAGHHRDLETAVFGQHVQRGVRPPAALERLREQGALAEQAGIVQTGAAAGDGVQVGVVLGADQAVGDQRRRRRVADAHLAEADAVAAVGGERMGNLAAALQRGIALLGRHRRLFEVVRRARRDLGVDQRAALAEVVTHPGVDHGQPQPHLPAEDIDRRAAGEEVLHHLPGHVLRIGRYASLRRAVVAGEDDDVRLADLGRQRLLHQADLVRQRLELAERAERLGLVVDLLLQRGGEQGVGRGDGEGCHAVRGWVSVSGCGGVGRRVRQVAVQVGQRQFEAECGQREAGGVAAGLAQDPAPVFAAGEALDVGAVL